MYLSNPFAEPPATALRQIRTEVLADRCAAEAERFFRRQPCDPQFGYELFRRALVGKDELAWKLVYAQYQGLVAGWLKQTLRTQVVEPDRQALVDDVFVKVTRTFARHPEKFDDYGNLSALLGLLRLCSQRVALDYLEKVRRQPTDLAFDEDMNIIAPTPTNSDTLWSTLTTLLQDEQEQLVARYLLIEAYKPRHLYADHPDLFQGIDEINTIRERIKARLRRNGAFRQFLHESLAT